MRKSQKPFKALHIICLLFVSLFTMYSCCEEGELTLKGLQVCGEKPTDLEDATCDDDVSVLDIKDEITASVEVFQAEDDSKLTFRIYQKDVNGDYILIDGLTEEKNISEFEDKCGVRVADGWTTNGGEWPEADIRIEVELNSSPTQTLSKEVEIRN